MQTMDFAYGLLSGILSGSIVGYIIEHIRLKNSKRIESIKRLTPYIESVHRIIEELGEDVSYFQKVQLRNSDSEFESFLNKIQVTFDKYNIWYAQFQSNGLKPELEAQDRLLLSSLTGLFIHSQLSKKYGKDHVFRELKEISDSLKTCSLEIKKFLRP